MAIINSYPTATPTGNDLIIGTDVSVEGNPTKTFTIDSINALATGTPASGTVDTIPIFTSAVAVGDSTITKSGSNYTIDGSLIMTGDITVPDTKVLRVGSQANGDLRIYHDGNNSYIDDQGTGDLLIKGSTRVFISTSSGGQMAQFDDSGSARLYFNGGLKFSTAAAGASVSGSLTVQGSAGNNGLVTLAGNGAVNGVTDLNLAVGSVNKVTVASTGTTFTGQINLDALNTAPASASATGTLGEIRFTADHIYVCVATNTWKRVAIATF